MVKVFIPRDKRAGETRVGATPETVKKFKKLGLELTVEAGAGLASHFADAGYQEAGAVLTTDPKAAAAEAHLLLTLGPPEAEVVEALKPGTVLVGLLGPFDNLDLVRTLKERKINALAMELVPRISRAQSMDALSSQANIAGYKAVLLAAYRLGSYFPLLMTAAGTIKPARVVIMGAGVAGLQAIATARRLGAVVEVSDIRPVVKEQVESLGAKFIPLPGMEDAEGAGGYAKEMTPEFLAQQRQIVKDHLSHADVAITTALVPGKKAPMLISKDMVEAMPAGAVIVDLAVLQGGNCELSKLGEEVVHNDVLILGPANLPAETPRDASTVYARNLLNLATEIVQEERRQGREVIQREVLRDGVLLLDLEDEVIAGSLVTYQGEVKNEIVAKLLQGGN